jgi:hypothetical protein
MSTSNNSVSQAAIMAIMSSLTPLRQQSVKKITTELVNLRLSTDIVNTILAAIILEAAEKQYIDEGGAIPPPRESSVEVLRNLFTEKVNKMSEGTN